MDKFNDSKASLAAARSLCLAKPSSRAEAADGIDQWFSEPREAVRATPESLELRVSAARIPGKASPRFELGHR